MMSDPRGFANLLEGHKAYAGVDIGSSTAKSVVVANGKVVSYVIQPTGPRPEVSGHQVLLEAIGKLGLKREDVEYVVATGYGRISAPFADTTVTEITCHATGGYFNNKRTRTIIDVGGQDCKVIRLDEYGRISDFAMNDKCAAGTGRFLDLLSRILGVGLEDLGPLSAKATENIAISSTCIVFAESEVVSLLARGATLENIIRGVHNAMAQRIAGMLSRTGLEQDFVFSGGGAKNSGLRASLEEALGAAIILPENDPQLLGAVGAAVLAENGGLPS
jgi:predicted CoA-substrate-specific enzyme activase